MKTSTVYISCSPWKDFRCLILQRLILHKEPRRINTTRQHLYDQFVGWRFIKTELQNQLERGSGWVSWHSDIVRVLTIFIIIRIIKLIIDILIRYALHSVYGWNIHLLGAVWSSITHLLLHLGNRPREEPTASKDNFSAGPFSPTEEQCPDPRTLQRQ